MVLKNILNRKRKTIFYLFGGKGGVGKTSTAASTALAFAESGKKTLIISTDPAHSISDSFETDIGHKPTKLRKNLEGVEIDPKEAMKDYKEKFMPEMEKVEALKGMGLEDSFDMAGMAPGVDEAAAFEKFMSYMHSGEYDIIVFDTAPTGHTLKLLSLPEVLDSWVGKMIMLRSRFSGAIGMVKKLLPFTEDNDNADIEGEKLQELKDRICEAREMLQNPERTNYNLVMIPEEMSILESERCLVSLKEYGIPVKDVIINKIIPKNAHCKFCGEKREQQLERVIMIEEKFKGYRIRKSELFIEEVKGVKMLERMSKMLGF